MFTYFLTLGLSPDASDERIREAYIRLVKKHPPEKDPDRFQAINKAYEAIKDKRTRVRTRIFSPLEGGELEGELLSLARAGEIRRRRATLSELVETCRKLRKKG